MNFKIDENLPLSAKNVLVKHGHECHSVFDESLQGTADTNLVEICRREERHLITLDLDFADIITFPPADYHGIIVLRLSRQDSAFVAARLGKVISDISAMDLPGHLVIIDDSRIRYR